MSVSYHIVLKSPAGSQVAILTDWRDLRFIRTVNGLSGFVLEIDGNDSRISLFELDGQIEIWRGDIDAGITKYKEFEGLIRAFEQRVTADGHQVFQAEGRGYNDILARRIIAYYAGSSQSDKSAAAETVMKEYVNENAGPGATFPPRLLASGVTTGLSIQTNTGGGSTWTGSRAYRNLLDILQEIANETDYDFDVVGIGNALYEFRTYASQRGSDRTTTGLNHATGLNSAGNAPVIFSTAHGNLEQPVYRDTRLNESNAVYVLGQGAESSRTIALRSDSSTIDDSPINRREIARDARNEDTAAGLNSRGDAILEENQRRQGLRFKFIATPATQYGRNFFFGDKITAQFKTLSFDKKIVGLTAYVRNPTSEVLEFELADLSFR